MKALTIESERFKQEPQDLETTMGYFRAYEKVEEFGSVWRWKDNIGNIVVCANNPGIIEISANDRAHVVQGRINRLARRIKELYKDAEIRYCKDFYVLGG